MGGKGGPPMTTEAIVEVLQEWILRETAARVKPERPYAESGELDSFDVMNLIVFAEQRFGITFAAADFGKPEFSTLSGLAELIQARIRQS